MERLINHENIYKNIKNLLENEKDTEKIIKYLCEYHFSIQHPNIKALKKENKRIFKKYISIYSKISFYLLTRLTCFDYDEDIILSGFSLAAYCFEIVARNEDVSEEEIEESKFFSAICYSLACNAANSIVMARLIKKDDFFLYRLFLKRDYKLIVNEKFDSDDIIANAIKRMSYSLIYK